MSCRRANTQCVYYLHGMLTACDGMHVCVLQECVARCAVNKYSQLMEVFLPSHGRVAMTMADATRAFIRNILGLDGEEMSVHEVTHTQACTGMHRHAQACTGMHRHA